MSMSQYLNKEDRERELILEELKRLEALDDLQLYECLVAMDDDPAPKWVKDLVTQKIRNIINSRIGLPEEKLL